MEIHQSRSLAGLSVADQKILCAIAYLGRNHPLMLPDEKMLSWMGCDKHSYKDQVKNLSSIGWLVEDAQHHESCHLLLINPKKLSEVLDFLLTAGRERIQNLQE